METIANCVRLGVYFVFPTSLQPPVLPLPHLRDRSPILTPKPAPLGVNVAGRMHSSLLLKDPFDSDGRGNFDVSCLSPSLSRIPLPSKPDWQASGKTGNPQHSIVAKTHLTNGVFSCHPLLLHLPGSLFCSCTEITPCLEDILGNICCLQGVHHQMYQFGKRFHDPS